MGLQFRVLLLNEQYNLYIKRKKEFIVILYKHFNDALFMSKH